MLREMATESFRERLRRLRLERGLSVGDLAQRAGVTEGAIRQMESGQTKNASFRTGLRLAKVLEVDANYLAEGNDVPGVSFLDPAPSPDEDYVLLTGGSLSKRLSLNGFLNDVILPAIRTAGYRLEKADETGEPLLASEVRLLRAKVDALQDLVGKAMTALEADRRGKKGMKPNLRLLQATESPNPPDRPEDR